MIHYVEQVGTRRPTDGHLLYSETTVNMQFRNNIIYWRLWNLYKTRSVWIML